ncbi:MAG: hypothetical protein GY943_28095 [Chloroflexi bacterium]|nr:hypothetical protein [Chloroflexota bacterium]
MIIKRGVPVFIAVLIGLLTLVSLVVSLPQLNNILLNWASVLAAIALLFGVLNLFAIHTKRLFRNRNIYSGILVLSMLAVFVLAVTDTPTVGLTNDGVGLVFNWIQFPLEAAFSSLLAFFLLIAGFQFLKRQRNGWSVLFILTAILILLGHVLTTLLLVPDSIQQIADQGRRVIEEVFVTAGMRGILLGIALGTITLSVRLLLGMERPYNK